MVSVTVTWTTSDDNTTGGIDVERSSDGGATWQTIASSLGPDESSYTDTNVTRGTTYEYRIERTTDHATAVSDTTSERPPKQLTRITTLAGAGQTDTTRTVSKSRTATTEGDGQTETTRGTSKARVATIDGDGSLAASRLGVNKARTTSITSQGQIGSTRTVSKPRTATLTGDAQLNTTRIASKARRATLQGDGQLDVSRSGVSKLRTATLVGDGEVAATRSGVAKSRTATPQGDGQLNAARLGVSKLRTATLVGDGEVAATRSGVAKSRTATPQGDGQLDVVRVVSKARLATLQADAQLTASRAASKPRTATLQGDGKVVAFADFSEALGTRLSGIYIDYDTALKAFATEWYEEHPIDERQDLMSLRFTSQVETPLRFAIESDIDGDGEPEHRSRWLEFDQGHVPRIYPSVPTDAAQYRVLMRGLRTQDVLRRIDTAFVFD